jgi:hypothetical protein
VEPAVGGVDFQKYFCSSSGFSSLSNIDFTPVKDIFFRREDPESINNNDESINNFLV